MGIDINNLVTQGVDKLHVPSKQLYIVSSVARWAEGSRELAMVQGKEL